MDKVGLILEGGALRGLFSAGVMDVMMEEKIRFHSIIGVSAGAAFGCNYKSGQIGRVLRYNKRFCRDKRYCSWHSWWKTGDLFGADFCYRQLPDELDIFDRETYDRDPANFYLVCTDLATGKAHYQLCNQADEKCYLWMRASASMPLVSNAVEIDGRMYLDGAIADSVPIKFFEENVCQKNVVILTQSAGYRKKPQKMMWLLKRALRKYPAVIKTLEKRHENYNQTMDYLDEQEHAGNIITIRPHLPLPIDRICHDPQLIQQTYDIGREAALAQIGRIKAFCAQ